MRVAFQGEAGAFSDDVAALLVPGCSTCGYSTFDDVALALSRGDIDQAVLPAENSIAGPIARVYDLLWTHDDLTIVGEHTERIVQNLIGTSDARIEDIREVRSHPVALEQCRTFLAAHPAWRNSAVADTAGAVRALVAEGDRSVAAIASRGAATLYGASIVSAAVQDDRDNFTRFFLVRRKADQAPDPQRVRRRACIALLLANEAGALRNALTPFAERGLNLRSLVSRPSRILPFAYRFYCEIEEAEHETLVEALARIEGVTRVLGEY